MNHYPYEIDDGGIMKTYEVLGETAEEAARKLARLINKWQEDIVPVEEIKKGMVILPK